MATACAEADPAYFYGGYGYPYGYYGYGLHSAVPFGSSTGQDPITQGLDPVTQGALPYHHFYGKRSADAEADPALVYAGYGYPYAYGLHAFAGKSAPCVNAANVPVPCAGAPLAYAGYPYAPVAYGRKKREAEAEAEAEADPALLYGAYGYPYAGYGYGLGYAGYPYAGLYAGVHATNAALGHAVAYTAAGAVHSSHVGVCTNYLGAQVPC